MSMMLESQTLPNIEGKAMTFTLDIQDAQFNHEGWYYLVITLQHSAVKDYSTVRVQKSDSGVWETKRQVQTDFTRQEENTPLAFFHDKRFTFKFPKGFFKNDKNFDVYLLVEAFTTADTTEGKGRKVGEGKFAIYPRPNAPRMKLYAEPGEDYYHYTDVMSLLRTHSTDNITMHCGRIRCTYSICEIVPPKPKTPPPASPPRTSQKRPSPAPSPVPKEVTPRDSQPPTGRLSKPADNRAPDLKPQPPPEIKKPVPPTPASSWGDNLSLDLNLPKSPPLPPATDGKKLPEAPRGDGDKSTFAVDKSYRHVASQGVESIEVILHGAGSLPLTPDGQVPQPYAVVKTKSGEAKNKKSGAVTHATRPTHSPYWEEMVSVSVAEDVAKDDELLVCVADGATQKGLVTYRVPIANLTPFHQYHMEMNMPAKGIPSGVKTFATITRKLPRIPADPSCPNYLALEVLLMAVQRVIKTPLGPLIAVARIVPDYYNYKSDNLLSHPRNTGVVMENISFPAAHPSNFAVTERSSYGHPQLSLPGRPEEQPVWNHPYLFVEHREKATLFTPGAALVIEYYVAAEVMPDQFWRMHSPIAFSAILMDEEMYKHLTADRAKHGLRINDVPIQPYVLGVEGSDMSTIDGRQPTVGLILRLITTETPDSMVAVSNLDDVPTLDLYPPSDVPGYYRGDSPDILKIEPGRPPAATQMPETPLSPAHTPKTPPDFRQNKRDRSRDLEQYNTGKYVLQRVKKRPLSPLLTKTLYEQDYHTESPIKDGEMPPFTAMESILPDYQYIFQPGEGGTHQPRTPTRTAKQPTQPRIPEGIEGDDVDANSFLLLDHQTKELGNYRDAVHKMGADILTLRRQIQELENVNSSLRRDLANYNDASRLMIDSSELDGLTKPEVLSRYAAIKQTLSSQTMDLKAYKDKLQKAQNELIKKNDQEKNFLKTQQTLKSQQTLINQLQERLKKLKKLEEACKKQENVIQQMEKVLEKHHRDRSKYQKDKASQDANEVLLQENKRLRETIDELRLQLRTAGVGNPNDDLEKMELYQALEKAEGRIAALERQLAENARSWGKERAGLNLKLNEAEHGFGRSAGMVLHDYPVIGELGHGKSSLKRLSPVYR
ncbi:coiled-coil domain-containing protein 33-like isoform X2 [Dreissena polymorpha]|uniref:coiled-coil domain-containing protein 33-like isoform X2 n=1 Tax=Dreissena polymorpha TaxID=45954 RepID=UPI0022640B9F|nr:coiled-coil domain-containing protein 33-like isoform X2 [Dreissena polymorpha]